MATSQILSVLSQLPLSTLAPSGEKEQELTHLECPLRVQIRRPVVALQILTVESYETCQL